MFSPEDPPKKNNPFFSSIQTNSWMKKLSDFGVKASNTMKQGIEKMGEGLDQVMDEIEGTNTTSMSELPTGSNPYQKAD